MAIHHPGDRFLLVCLLQCIPVLLFQARAQCETEVTLPDTSFLCPGNVEDIQAPSGFDVYLWSTGDTTQSIEPAAAGTYCITATDNEGCVSTACTEVFIDTLVVTILNDPYVCAGGFTILETDAPDSLGFTWSTGSEQPFAIVQSAGEYCVTVTTDSCTGSACIEIQETQADTPVITGVTQVCFGDTVSLTASAGYVDYQWSNGDTGQEAHISTGGNYCVTVTDDHGCTSSSCHLVFTLSLELDLEASPGIVCPDSISVITARVPGAPLSTFLWSTGDTTASIITASAGTYCVTATNFTGCTASRCMDISQYEERDVTVSGPSQFCNGKSALLVSSGDWDTYTWSTGETGPELEVNVGGFYYLTVTDACGYTATDVIVVQQVDALMPDIDYRPSCQDHDTLDLGNAHATWEYAWNTGDLNTPIVVPSGTYAVTVADQTGCTGSASIDVVATPVVVTDARVMPDPGSADGSIEIQEVTGSAPFTYLWEGGAMGSVAGNLLSGTYDVTIIDARGCQVVEEYYVPLRMTENADRRQIMREIVIPNPTDGTLVLYPDGHPADRLDILIQDIYGYPVYRGQTTGTQRLQISLNCSAGIYVLYVFREGDVVSVRRFVKL